MLVKEVNKSDGLWRFACGDVFIQKWQMFQYKLKESQTVYEKVWFERMNRIKNEKKKKENVAVTNPPKLEAETGLPLRQLAF